LGVHSLHLVAALLAALGLAAVIWIWPHSIPQPDGAESAARQMFTVSIGVLVYLAIQAIAIIGQPFGSERRILLDMLFSLLPLIVIIYAEIDAARGALELSVIEQMMLGLAAVACVIDVGLFTWFALRIMRRSPEITMSR
jgi:hypothetical protein